MGGLVDMVSNFFDSLFGGADRPSLPQPPAVEAPPTMPTPDDKAVEAARKRSIAAQVARRGRQSTILSQNDDAVGGAISGADKLGG